MAKCAGKSYAYLLALAVPLLAALASPSARDAFVCFALLALVPCLAAFLAGSGTGLRAFSRDLGWSPLQNLFGPAYLFALQGLAPLRKHAERAPAPPHKPWRQAKYRYDGLYYPAQVLSPESGERWTVKFEWGCLQMSTTPEDIDWAVLDLAALGHLTQLASGGGVVGTVAEDDDVWRAARRGDLRAVQSLAPLLRCVDAPEPVGTAGNSTGRSALYWACLTGHVAVVKLLLSLGAQDSDGSAYQAATCAAPVRARDDARDLLFDPDTDTYTDDVARADDGQVQATDGNDDVSREIRALLVASRVKAACRPLKLQAVYDDFSSCAVCFEVQKLAVAVPCGHQATCFPCLKKIRDDRLQGCPICRQRIWDFV
jgi:hypothetical protein